MNDTRLLHMVRTRLLLVASLVAVLVMALLPSVALGGHNPDGTDPCADAPTADEFADYDDARDTHKPSIDCALYRGITSGAGTNAQGEPIYRPLRPVTRAQMAQFIVNTIEAAGYDSSLPGGQGRDEFSDISDSFARVAINRLARADIVGGTGGDRYSPKRLVSRQQMASFIVQAARHVVGDEHPVRRDGDDQFRDVSRRNVHKANIEAGADANLFRGTSATTFSPGEDVLRDQMATFLVNLLRYTFNPDTAPAPKSAEIAIAERNVEAGGEVTGDITGESIKSASVSGCGLNNVALTDEDGQAEGIQFKVTIPESQEAGDCTLTFSITFDDDSVRRFTEAITVTTADGATVTLDKTTVNPGESITGAITGTDVKSATVSGCGLTNEPVQDRDSTKEGIQFSEAIPATQRAGDCTLTFTVTFEDNTTQDVTKQLTVQEKTGVTTQPELISAAIVSTTPTGGSNPGTVVRFVFDEAVTGAVPAAASFRVYAFDASQDTGDSAQVESSDTSSVLVRFNGILTESDARDLTTAGVAAGAVRDNQNQQNPEGAAALGTQREETVRQPGITAAPDLQAVGGFRPVDASTTAVDFTFDEAAFVVNRSGFNLVLKDGRVANCQGPARDSTTGSGTSSAGGNGTTTITAICTNPTANNTTTALNASTVARGYVNQATVSDTQQVTQSPQDPNEGNVNPLQAAVTADGATSDTPDLIGAEYRPSATGGNDTVVYTFDEEILPLPVDPLTGEAQNASSFRVYDTAGAETQAEDAERNSSNTRQVIATFEPGTLTDAVGASVRAGAVTGATGAGTNQPNRADEVGVTNSNTRTITPGKTQAPDLVSVAVNPQNGSAVYTFDEAVNSAITGSSAATPSRFKLWGSKGEQFTCSGVAGTGTFSVGNTDSTNNQVTCSRFSSGSTSTATAAQVGAAVLGSVAYQAVDDREAGPTPTYNPEGAAPTTGTTGKPEN